jgi:hypothetical protein
LCPNPSWKEYIRAQRFHVARRNVDQQPVDLSVGYGFEMIANGLNVPITLKTTGFNTAPKPSDEIKKRSLVTECVTLIT